MNITSDQKNAQNPAAHSMTSDSNRSSREAQLQSWLAKQSSSLQLDVSSLVPASSDASFRRYFRINADNTTLIVMDAPPLNEDCRPFVNIAQAFRSINVRVPEIVAQDLDQGFLLLTDFGQRTFLDAVKGNSAQDAAPFYNTACSDLVLLQQQFKQGQTSALPLYNREVLLREMMLYPDWYVKQHKGITLNTAQTEVLYKSFELIIENNLAQCQVAVHRDYHSRNLMVLPMANESSEIRLGMIDFQDALYGPASYDLVSLLRDAYIEWQEHDSMDWSIRYWEKARKAGIALPDQFGDFYRDFEWMGLQRHLKVLGIFARLAYRDGKLQYLNDIPLVLRYALAEVSRYNALAPLANLMRTVEGQSTDHGYTF